MDPLDLPIPVPKAVKKAHELGLEISLWTVYKLIRDGVLPCSKHGRKLITVRGLVDALRPPPSQPTTARAS